MMMRKLTVAALFILVAAATAHPYAEWSNTRYRWNAARGQDVGARVKSQASVELSSCALVTHTETTTDGKSHAYDHSVRICSADPEDSPNKVCLDTRVNPCCPSNCSLDNNMVSSAQVSVAGEVVTVAYYLARRDQAARVCFRLDDAHQRAKTCSQPVHKNGSCLPPCLDIIGRIDDFTCFNNTLTGDSSSCNGNAVYQCKTGYLPPDCCRCDTTNFYLPDCRPFCRDNCRLFQPANLGGCLTCLAGFTSAPECCQCEPGKTEVNGVCKRKDSHCDQPQNLFFYIDATYSNKFENFCPLIIVLQMIVAAFSPSPSSGIQIGSLLFSDNARRRGPSPVFETDTSCLNAVQGEGRSLLSLINEFGKCLDKHRKYDSDMFPSMCGEGASAVWGLKEIRDIVRTKSAHKSTVLMITDGIIEDDKEERTKVLSDLELAGVTIIEAGYGDADLSTMKLYTHHDNIMIDDDPVELGKAIVNKLKVKGILCDKYAKNVIESLERVQGNSLSLFCRCHRMENINHPRCLKKKYPVCGGDLSVGVNPTGMQESDLEEEILAAIENVLNRFNGH